LCAYYTVVVVCYEIEDYSVECSCRLVQYVWTLGVSEQWQFVDVWGFESELLQLLPRPICAVLLLYPLSDKVFHFFKICCPLFSVFV